METLLLAASIILAPLSLYFVIQRYRRIRRGHHEPGDTVGTMIDGYILGSIVEDVVDATID
jgi:hypothetical protein